MRTVITRLVIAVVLLAAGGALRRAALIEDRLAATQERLTTATAAVTPAAYDEVEAELGLAARIPFVGEAILQDVRRQRALAAYWNGDYATVSSIAGNADPSPDDVGPADDAELMFVAANASVRRAAQTGDARPELLRGLDEALRLYADVLQVDADHAGAAYNYELVSRLRSSLARGQRPDRLLPDGPPNIHGEEGAPPEGTKPPEFNVIVPMRPDERQEQFDAGEGGVTRRRG